MPSQKIVYTAGVFDLLHEGHLNIIERSKKLGDILVVGVVSDDGVEAYKGHRPVFSQEHRMAYMRALRHVDFVLIQPTTDPTPVLEILRPHVMTHGDDWERLKEGHESLEKLGVEFVLLPYTHGISSTKLREHYVRMAESLRLPGGERTTETSHWPLQMGCHRNPRP